MLQTEKTFHYELFRIRVAGDSSHLTWLEEFLSPQWMVDDSDDFQFRVILDENPEEYSQILELRSGTQDVDTFILDQEVLKYPCWSQIDGSRVIQDDKYTALYVLGHEPNRIRILAPGGSRRIRTALMRVVREVAMSHVRNQGGFFLHASAFEVDNQGIIVAGTKGAGKTTTLIYALQSERARFLSNDRVMVKVEGDNVRMRGMPTFPTIRQHSLAFFPALKSRIPENGFDVRRHEHEVVQAPKSTLRLWQDEKYGLNPLQFSHLLEARSISSCGVHKLVFARGGCEAGKILVEPISKDTALESLMDCLFGARNLRKTSEVFYPQTGKDYDEAGEMQRQCDEFLSKIQCFDVRIGLSEHSDNPDPMEFFDRVLE